MKATDIRHDYLTIDGLTVTVHYWIDRDRYPVDDIDGRSAGDTVVVTALMLGKHDITAWQDRFDKALFEFELGILERS